MWWLLNLNQEFPFFQTLSAVRSKVIRMALLDFKKCFLKQKTVGFVDVRKTQSIQDLILF